MVKYCLFDDKGMKLGTMIHYRILQNFLNIGPSKIWPLVTFTSIFNTENWFFLFVFILFRDQLNGFWCEERTNYSILNFLWNWFCIQHIYFYWLNILSELDRLQPESIRSNMAVMWLMGLGQQKKRFRVLHGGSSKLSEWHWNPQCQSTRTRGWNGSQIAKM